MTGIRTEMATMGSHFLNERAFNISIFWITLLIIFLKIMEKLKLCSNSLGRYLHLYLCFSYFQLHFTFEAKVPLFPLSDTNFTVPDPQ